MTQRIIFAHPWLFDRATGSGGDWMDDLPASNMNDMQPSRKARSSNVSSVYRVYQLEVATACNVLALIATNLSATAKVRVRGATSQANLTAAPGFDTQVGGIDISAWPASGRAADLGLTEWTVFKKLANSTAYVWWRIDIIDGSNGDGYVEIGRTILAPGFQPAINISYDWIDTNVSADVVIRTGWGHTLTQERLQPRAISVSLDWLTRAERYNGLTQIRRLRGLARDIVCCLDADETDFLHHETIHGLLGEPMPISNPRFEIHAAKVTISELV